MEWIMPVKIEIELFPDTLKKIEELSEKEGVSTGEIIDKAFTIRVPLYAENAVEYLVKDISLRTQCLGDEQKQIVYKTLIEYLQNKLSI